MKNKIFILLVILLLVFTVSGCKTKVENEIVGIVTETSDGGGFRVKVIGGFQEDLMQVQMQNKTKYEEGIDNVIKVGNAVGFTIEDEIMESYPVQTKAKRILWNEGVITGKILSSGETAILLQVSLGFDAKMLQAHITDETIFYSNIPKITEKGKVIGFTITGEILETEPQQVYVKRFVTYE